MPFDPKIVLASGVEGLADRRKGRRVRFWIGMAALLALLVSGAALGLSQFEDIFAAAGLSRPKKVSGSDLELFRRMSFLPNAERMEAPAYRLKTLDGQNRTLRQDRGKVVLVNFWATWCPPCLREMPAMQRLYEKFRGRGFEVVAVSVDQGNSEAVRKFVNNLKLSFPIVLDPDQVTKQAYRVRALPTTFLIDRLGRVVALGMGAREWDGEAAFGLIEHLLGEKG